MYTTRRPPAIFPPRSYAPSGLGGNFFSDLWETIKTVTIPGIKKSAMPWTIDSQDWEDIKNGEGIAAVGSPLHGISAGIAITRAFGNPIKGFENLRDMINDPSFELLGDQIQEQIDYSNKAWDQGKYPVFFFVGNWVGGVMAGAGTTASEISTLSFEAEQSATAAIAALDAANIAVEAGTAIAMPTLAAVTVTASTGGLLTAGTIGAGIASGAILASLPPPIMSAPSVAPPELQISAPLAATLDPVLVTAQIPTLTNIGGTVGTAIATGAVVSTLQPPAIAQTTLEQITVTAQKPPPLKPINASLTSDIGRFFAGLTTTPSVPTNNTIDVNHNADLNKDLNDPNAGSPTWWENLIKKYGVPYLLKNLPGILQKLFGGTPTATELQTYQDYLNSQQSGFGGIGLEMWLLMGLIGAGIVISTTKPPRKKTA